MDGNKLLGIKLTLFLAHNLHSENYFEHIFPTPNPRSLATDTVCHKTRCHVVSQKIHRDNYLFRSVVVFLDMGRGHARTGPNDVSHSTGGPPGVLNRLNGYHTSGPRHTVTYGKQLFSRLGIVNFTKTIQKHIIYWR